MKNPNQSVLVVDDDIDIRYAIVRMLGKCECDVVEASSVECAFEQMQSQAFDTVFSDIRFPTGLSGEDLLKRTGEKYPHINVVLMTSALDKSKQNELMEKGAAFCLQKPFFLDTCLTVLGKPPKEKI